MTIRNLSLGYSPCPNDTYIFYALVHGRIPTPGLRFSERLEDVETLNNLALSGLLDISKVSYHALGFLRDSYWLLRSGGALGRGCGPLVIAREKIPMEGLRGMKIAVPGRYTTASLLLRLYDPLLENLVFLPFHHIMDAVAKGEVDAGVIIHESRFTYQTLKLTSLLDLGAWWELESGHPLPLGGIVVRRTLPVEVVKGIECALRESLDFAHSHGAEVTQYIRAHSQEMSDEVCAAHINLYVNLFSHNLGAEGEAAVTSLFSRAEAAGLIPASASSLFAP